MSRLIALGVLLLFSSQSSAVQSTSPPRAPAADQLIANRITSPKLEFKVDGRDLIVSTVIQANNSPHVLLTSWRQGTKPLTIQLKYILIQNKDLFVRSLKTVRVTWRLKGIANAPTIFNYEVVPQRLSLTSAQLNTLLRRSISCRTDLQSVFGDSDVLKIRHTTCGRIANPSYNSLDVHYKLVLLSNSSR